MRNNGNKLRGLIKSKGFDLVSLAKTLNITTAAIQKDMNNPELTRKALVKYVPLVITNVDDFYNDTAKGETKVEEYVSDNVLMSLKDALLASQEETIREQRRHIDTLTNMLRFFPNAVQQTTITA